MNSLLISRNRDMVIGLRLAGMKGVWADTQDSIEDHFEQAVTNPDIGNIVLTEDTFEQIRERVYEHKRKDTTPLVVTIPERGGLKDKDFIMRYVKDSVGIKVD